MRCGGLKVEAVAGFQAVFFAVDDDFQIATEHVDELFSIMCVGVAAASVWSDAEQVRLHDCVAPGQQFHAYATTCFENLAFFGTNTAAAYVFGVEEIQDIGFVKAGELAQSAHRAGHLRAFHGTEKSDGYPNSVRDLREGKLAARAQLAEMGSDSAGASIAGGPNLPFALEQLHDGSRVESADLAQEASALEKFYVFIGVEPVLALGAAGPSQAEALPRADDGRRDANFAGDVSDFQVRFIHLNVYVDPQIASWKEISIGRTRFFLLDSVRAPSLTLRDYSKVVARIKRLVFIWFS